MDIAIQRLQTSGLAVLITGWVGDQDSSVLKQLRECPAAHNSQVHLDPGHAKKNLVNALDSLFGEKKAFDGLAKRIPAFILRCTKRAENEHAGDVTKMREQFLQWLDCVKSATHTPSRRSRSAASPSHNPSWSSVIALPTATVRQHTGPFPPLLSSTSSVQLPQSHHTGSPASGDANRRIVAGGEEMEALRGSFRTGREASGG